MHHTSHIINQTIYHIACHSIYRNKDHIIISSDTMPCQIMYQTTHHILNVIGHGHTYVHCVCICLCICTNALYICMHVPSYVCMHACMHVCMYVCMYVFVYTYMYVCMYVCTYVCNVCICMCVFVHVCMYVSCNTWHRLSCAPYYISLLSIENLL